MPNEFKGYGQFSCQLVGWGGDGGCCNSRPDPEVLDLKGVLARFRECVKEVFNLLLHSRSRQWHGPSRTPIMPSALGGSI